MLSSVFVSLHILLFSLGRHLSFMCPMLASLSDTFRELLPMRNLSKSPYPQVWFKYLSLGPPQTVLSSGKAFHPVCHCPFASWFLLYSEFLTAPSTPSASVCLSYNSLVNICVGICIGCNKFMSHLISQIHQFTGEENISKLFISINIFHWLLQPLYIIDTTQRNTYSWNFKSCKNHEDYLTHLLYFLDKEMCIYLYQFMCLPADMPWECLFAHTFSLAWVLSASYIFNSEFRCFYICLLVIYLSSFVKCLFIFFSHFWCWYYSYLFVSAFYN